MSWFSDVVVKDNGQTINYVLKVEATGTDKKVEGQKVSVEESYPVTKLFDDKGYFHIRRASDLVIDDILQRLTKAINKSV